MSYSTLTFEGWMGSAAKFTFKRGDRKLALRWGARAVPPLPAKAGPSAAALCDVFINGGLTAEEFTEKVAAVRDAAMSTAEVPADADSRRHAARDAYGDDAQKRSALNAKAVRNAALAAIDAEEDAGAQRGRSTGRDRRGRRSRSREVRPPVLPDYRVDPKSGKVLPREGERSFESQHPGSADRKWAGARRLDQDEWSRTDHWLQQLSREQLKELAEGYDLRGDFARKDMYVAVIMQHLKLEDID
eukprot:gene26778-6914_t